MISSLHYIRINLFLLLFLCFSTSLFSQIDNYKEYTPSGRGFVFTSQNGNKIKLTPYGNNIIRLQAVRRGEEFFADNYYEMVESHNWSGKLNVVERNDYFIISCTDNSIIKLLLTKNPLRIKVLNNDKILFSESSGIEWKGNKISESFTADDNEHFTGLGHGFFGREPGIDLKGRVIGRNYGTNHGDQSPLLVPFYMSSKGYGIFLNSTFTNQFSFNKDGSYSFGIDTYGEPGRLDYFIIVSPQFSDILRYYTQLTGKPRLPPLAIFGLGLSDKSNDEISKDPSDENWWKRKVIEERKAGFPIDHLVNDNRWRAGGGKRCESYFDWDKQRFPDPAEFESWVKKNGLITTIDFNRCIGSGSEGWLSTYNIPFSDKVDHSNCVPDFTRKDVRNWFWGLFWNKSLNPKLNYPGDALWIDEFDELGPIADTIRLGNGKIWGEMKNYWPFLIAKSLVQEGWDKTLSPAKRPFVWVRGMSAGAQRYATLWTGDIKPTYEDMKNQIIAVQLAGLSGFPFEGHDAGGFYDWDAKKGPDEILYRKWSMALGCFTPFWKPHGWGQSRWPVDRSPESMKCAKFFTQLRYQLLPYTYTMAYQSSNSGLPMVRAMILENQNDPPAWKYDQQFMWGNDFLVVPNTSDKDSVNLWLPSGNWYDYNTNKLLTGNRTTNYYSPDGGITLFVKEGAIIPKYYPALSTAFIDKGKMIVDVYSGTNGIFALYEDDGISENYRNGEMRQTNISYNENAKELTIGEVSNYFEGAPQSKSYKINFIGLHNFKNVLVNGEKMVKVAAPDSSAGYYYDSNQNILTVITGPIPVTRKITIDVIN